MDKAMFDLTPVLQLLFTIAAALITAYLLPWIKSKTTTQQRAAIQEWVRIAVSAAEMIYAGSGRGEEKKAHVLEFLREKGFSVDEKELDALIEAAVFALKLGCEANEISRKTDCLISNNDKFTQNSLHLF